jgi:hypothetical protein
LNIVRVAQVVEIGKVVREVERKVVKVRVAKKKKVESLVRVEKRKRE